MLRYSKEIAPDILKSFECGVPTMDEYIHSSLESLLKENSQFTLFVATEDTLGVVAIIITSTGNFVDLNNEYHDLPFGKPWGYISDDHQVHQGVMYPTLEIDFLAVRKDLRCKGFGSQIVNDLSIEARTNNCFFITVDAFHAKDYSAIPFYEKQGFFALQEYSDEYDTLRMALRV